MSKTISIRKVSDATLHEMWLSGQMPYQDYTEEITRRTRKPLRDTLARFVHRLNSSGDETGTEARFCGVIVE